MASQSNAILSGLARKLIIDGFLDEPTALDAVASAQKNKKNLVSYLVENDFVDAKSIAVTASKEFGVPLFDVNAIDFEQIATSVISENLIQKHHAIPLFKRGKRLYVGVSDPTNLAALDEFKFHSGLTTEAVLLEENKLTALIDKILEEKENEDIGSFEEGDFDDLDLETVDEDKKEDDDSGQTKRL